MLASRRCSSRWSSWLNVTSLLESAYRLQPEAAALDVSLARDGSLAWIAKLRERCPDTKLLALSVHDEPSVRRTATSAGCYGFVLKRAMSTDLLPAVERLLVPTPNQQRRLSTSDNNAEE